MHRAMAQAAPAAGCMILFNDVIKTVSYRLRGKVIMPNEEQQIRYSKYFIYIIVFCTVCVSAWNLFGGRADKSGGCIYNNGNGTGNVGAKLQQAIGNQQTINDGIRDSQATVENIGTSIDRSQTAERTAAEAVERAASLVEESGRLAAANTEIIKNIRSRGLAGNWAEDGRREIY